jgi:cytidylate kinase
MSIVAISRESYTQAKEVAEKTAQKLGFECISREVLIEASEEFNVPEIKLLRAIRDAPSVLDRFTFGKERYTAYVQAALLDRLQGDNVVYHGLAGHYFVRGISHVLKVRIIGKKEDRVKVVRRRAEIFEQAATAMKGMPGQSLLPRAMLEEMSWERASRVVEEIDEARRKWGLHLYGIDTHDPRLYDLVIHLDTLSIEDAAELICHTAGLNPFQATAESQQVMDDLLLAARIKANLIEHYPRVKVSAHEGAAYISLEGGRSSEKQAIQDRVGEIPGVKSVNINVYPFVTPD